LSFYRDFFVEVSYISRPIKYDNPVRVGIFSQLKIPRDTNTQKQVQFFCRLMETCKKEQSSPEGPLVKRAFYIFKLKHMTFI